MPESKTFTQHELKSINEERKYTLVIHGGAGTILRKGTEEGRAQEAAYREALQLALIDGENVLRNGGTAMEAVVAAVRFMEDSPLFNAGHGSVFNGDGRHECDASVMDGEYRAAGAVGAVTTLKNPVDAALKVMSDSGHVCLVGEGAERFAASRGCDVVPNSYFGTEHRLAQFLAIKEKEKELQQEASESKSPRKPIVALDHADLSSSTSASLSSPSSASTAVTDTQTHKQVSELESALRDLASPTDIETESFSSASTSTSPYPCTSSSAAVSPYPCHGSSASPPPLPVFSESIKNKFGTVGAVARDIYGNVAAATSTGGMTNKMPGRLGDSPCIGAGTYADNLTAAVSCTGYGEYFLRGSVAYDVCAMMEYTGASVQAAAQHVVHEKFRKFHLRRPGGRGVAARGKSSADACPADNEPLEDDDARVQFRGGLIAVDRDGGYAFPFNSAGMYRGVVTEHHAPQAFIFLEDELA